MKKIMNRAEDVENEMILGIVKSAPAKLRKLDCGNVVVKNNLNADKVAVISGGGSGHEPAHCGYVGEGMLDAAVAGPVFAGPSPELILEAIRAVANDRGVLCIVKNYYGDIMNFEEAIDMAQDEDIRVDYVVVNDDVAVKDSLYTTGRRGVAGTVLVEKIAGAAAESGLDLDEVAAIAEKAVANVRSMGMALSACTMPMAGVPSFNIAENEMEIGIGIHGEPGISRGPLKTANEIAEKLLRKITEDIEYTGHEVVVMINGMGSTPKMELYIVNNFVQDYLAQHDIRVYDTLVGTYMSSIDMAGFSITLLRLDDELKRLYDAKADTLAFRK